MSTKKNTVNHSVRSAERRNKRLALISVRVRVLLKLQRRLPLFSIEIISHLQKLLTHFRV